ncbi:hypothetical protein C7M84_007361 [Penaeus vannamei]|uniref:Ig-like domain-containing protein n=1 Tax=Penaeus vannamei TaxID=6689 RepID=A0A3R7P356_PENVA|nr:hypothetical protein C7M84_007361 [Penaeus vannamei]
MSAAVCNVSMVIFYFLAFVLSLVWTHAEYIKEHPGRNSPTAPTGPHFLTPATQRNVSTTLGQTAYLHCRVAQLGEKQQVSWIRKKDLHVLSSGMLLFASDLRFQVRGASRASIHGPEYVKAGSTINLTCVINQPHMQGLVHWYHNGNILDYEGPVSIATRGDHMSTVSHLTIKEATPKHSGNYTCWPTSAHWDSILINVVVEGEQPAAMQTGVGVAPSAGILTPILLPLLLHALSNALVDPLALR